MWSPTKEFDDAALAITAIGALIVSAFSLWYSRSAVRLAEAQDRRKTPLLVPALTESYFDAPTIGGRNYYFLLSVSNPTDSNNALAAIELHLNYLLDGGSVANVKLPALQGWFGNMDHRPGLAIPLRIPAHDTVAGDVTP
jgi:hypothetical protein